VRRLCVTSCCVTQRRRLRPAGRIGQSTRAATAGQGGLRGRGRKPLPTIFGTDYPTPDGTGVRDYIHVDDLASAHLNSLDYLRAGGKSLVANVGYGHGYSVREVLSSVEKIAGLKLDVREEPRRAGDPPSLVARCERVRELLKWQPRLDDIDTIVRTSLEWEKRLQREPW
jgi:UDP-glucose 4-epimerase